MKKFCFITLMAVIAIAATGIMASKTVNQPPGEKTPVATDSGGKNIAVHDAWTDAMVEKIVHYATSDAVERPQEVKVEEGRTDAMTGHAAHCADTDAVNQLKKDRTEIANGHPAQVLTAAHENQMTTAARRKKVEPGAAIGISGMPQSLIVANPVGRLETGRAAVGPFASILVGKSSAGGPDLEEFVVHVGFAGCACG